MRKREVERFLNLHTNAFVKKNLSEDVGLCNYTSGLHMYGIKYIEEILKEFGVVVKSEDWDGNEQEGTNYEKLSFVWNGVKVFELLDKKEGGEK